MLPKSVAAPPEPFFVMKADMASVHCLLFANFGGKNHLYVGTADGTVHLWNLQTNRRIKTLKPSDGPCLSLHFIDNYLITQDKTGLVKLWLHENENFTCLHTRNLDNLSFCKLSYLKNDLTYLAIPQQESKICVYSIGKNSLEFSTTLECSEFEGKKLGDVLVIKMVSIENKVFVASMYESGVLILWNTSTTKITTYDQLTSDTPMCFDFDCENLQGVCGTSGNSIIVFKFNPEEMKITKKKSINITNPGTGSLCIRPDKKILAAGCWDGRIRIFSWKNLKLLAALDCHQETVLDVCFFHNSQPNKEREYILSGGSSDRKVSLWNIYN